MADRRRGFWTSRRIAHAVFTVALSLGALLLGLGALNVESAFSVKVMALGYPPYFAPMLGIGYVLGAAVVLQGRRPRLREWSYAGFTFSFLAASMSHFLVGEVFDALVPLLMLGVLLVSYGTRGGGGD